MSDLWTDGLIGEDGGTTVPSGGMNDSARGVMSFQVSEWLPLNRLKPHGIFSAKSEMFKWATFLKF